MQPQIEHVSDTARMVAACRAMESTRPHPLVNDPFAARLAGDSGMALASSSPNLPLMQFGIGIRSRFVDELLGLALNQGVDTVLNLGAGLDTRPWRLDLPAGLRWIEADFPEMLEYKAAQLADTPPRCHLEQMSADLNQAGPRAAVLERASSGRGKPLLMTEGLLMYLPAETLKALAAEARNGGFRFWLLDVSSPQLMRTVHGDLTESINRVRAETHLAGQDILNVAEQNGWTVAERRSYVRDAAALGLERVKELSQSGCIELPTPPPPDDISGVWLYRS